MYPHSYPRMANVGRRDNPVPLAPDPRGLVAPALRHLRGVLRRDGEQKWIRDREQRVAREQGQVIEECSRAENHRKRYSGMRERIQNGVCPCCNRTFTNLARHMATKHPQLPPAEKLRHLRHQFGMTKADLAREIGLYQGASAVSRYETGRSVAGWRLARIERWLDEQLAA